MAHQESSRPLRASHLRQMSTGSSTTFHSAVQAEVTVPRAHVESTAPQARPRSSVRLLCNLSVHDENFSTEDVVLNLAHFPGSDVKIGTLMQLTALKGTVEPSVHDRKLQNAVQKPMVVTDVQAENIDVNRHHVFTAKAITGEMLAKQPNVQISISRHVEHASGFDKGSQVLVSAADETSCYASHVEIVFRDQYLTRGDMWRLVSAELANHCIFRGQKIVFLRSIKANIRTIFVKGRKVPSAFFHASTKPIFRSESARYVLFIQMSKEMWDFDAGGSGEIMFDKVINGFLPELFKRWQQMKVKHLISIVLFTRMLYDDRPVTSSPKTNIRQDTRLIGDSGDGNGPKDFYKVVVSDMASADWADVLNQLKREFKVFLRDISIRKPDVGDHLPLGTDISAALANPPSHVIAGRPSVATHGNVLEAINLASSQFSSDYIDRDLVRTGVSIVVLTPSAGLFEVDYNLLVATSDNLIDNGVGIDLVCLSKMPLHSVPLFKYRQPGSDMNDNTVGQIFRVTEDRDTPTGSYSRRTDQKTTLTSFMTRERPRLTKEARGSSGQQWSYGIPHWVDISFWTTSQNEDRRAIASTIKAKNKSNFDAPRHKTFVPRVKMYELQMMGVMENAISDISIPTLSESFSSSASRSMTVSTASMFDSLKPARIRPSSEAFGSQSEGSGDRTPKRSASITSGRSGNKKSSGLLFQWMDDYDDLLFCHPLKAKKRGRKAMSGRSKSTSLRNSPSLLGTSPGTLQGSVGRNKHSSDEDGFQGKAIIERYEVRKNVDGKEHTANTESRRHKFYPTPTANSRQISFGPQGFDFARAKAIATTSGYDAPTSLISQGFKSSFPIKHTASLTKLPWKAHINAPATSGSDPHEANSKDQDLPQSSDSEPQQTSRPIPIRKPTVIRVSSKGGSVRTGIRTKHELEAAAQPPDRLKALQDLEEEDNTDSTPYCECNDDHHIPTTMLSASTTLAPWLTMLNPSNPSMTKTALGSRLGRWQHIFPRPLPNSQIKWKSLCSPAAVPLTTEEFPSTEQLEEEYQKSVYEVELPEHADLSEKPRSLISEMVGFRISRGFQIVVGSRVAKSTTMPALQSLDIFDGRVLAEIGFVIFLSRGSIVQKLMRSNETKIEVTQFVRHGTIAANHAEIESMLYKPAICSTLARQYDIQEISILPQRGNFDWKMIDSFILGHDRPHAKDFVETLRPWRARFVLIPVIPPSSTRRPLRPMNEDNEEEIRLEGIRKLSQVWQKFRYTPPDERPFQMHSRKRKDTNPLDILYKTGNSSAIVAAELENVLEGDATGRPMQLLPDSDLYQRSNLNIASLAETIQTEKGVHMLDRRWHLRLHYNCFIGFELTTWLLQNFKDVSTRDEAVELGNELMEGGMFQHVEQRHNFRDGNYFYQIADRYRTPRPESRGWFGRGKVSVPSTPMSEDAPKELPTSRSRASSTGVSGSDGNMGTLAGKKNHLGVALSKSLLYDVDHRKRSYRPELINLHYDRLHNPDNCYHIRVEWMNATPKLVQDAVISWATLVDRFGLRLVEVPLGEACSISSMHPFRAPYLVKLAQQPPSKQPQSFFPETTTFAPQPRPEKHLYQIAIMKRFSFVLDFEAASDFPADVDVTYSWGKPDYRYPQYIHRSGTIIAQITDDGDFLLLANKLYNNRNVSPSSSHQDTVQLDVPRDPTPDRDMSIFHSSPHRGSHRHSPHFSPYNSPSIRASLGAPSAASATNKARTPIIAPTYLTGFARSEPTTAHTTPEAIKKDFEAFCADVDALETFYTEILHKVSASVPSTPSVGTKTPSNGQEAPINDNNIPTLALPGSLMSKERKGEMGGNKLEMKTRVVGEENVQAGGTAGGVGG